MANYCLELQWGRTLRARNTTMVDPRQSQMIELQWGRTLRARNTINPDGSVRTRLDASMGPYSESTEYTPALARRAAGGSWRTCRERARFSTHGKHGMHGDYRHNSLVVKEREHALHPPSPPPHSRRR